VAVVSAYVCVEIEIEDPDTYAEYIKVAPPSIAQYGGRYIVRGGEKETLEGDWMPKRFVILEFDSMEAAKAWWSSPEYAGPKALRQSCAKTQMLLVEGLPPGWQPS
jgi:uncharacterized protein (DUF1330 family)